MEGAFSHFFTLKFSFFLFLMNGFFGGMA